jgi:1-acyl-sn-glycerol-3-phosphate acyltransferase
MHLSRALGKSVLKLIGWKIQGQLPSIPKYVIIVAPHTSNWDFIVGLWAYFALGFKASWLGKHTIFKFPLGPFMRWLGGIPVERSIRKDRVAAQIDAFHTREQLVLIIAPEGTRKFVPDWKTGFYHVADGAHVPIVPVAFDFGQRVIRIFPPFRTTGYREKDIGALKDLYRGIKGKHPENFAL